MNNLVSIIIPTFNRAYIISETLDSVIAQTYPNWECIIIDDGSTDYTQELLEFYTSYNPKISYYRRPNNRVKGANSCRNYGFELSKGEYINWFDDDDIMHPEKLERQINSLINSNHNYSVCQALVFEKNPNNTIGFRNPLISSKQAFQDYLKMKISWLTQVPLWRKSFLEKQDHLFDETLHAAQEWEFHLRILNKFPDYVILNDALVFLRKHEFSITYNKNKEQRFWYYFQSRLMIYRNANLNLDENSHQFLKEYLLNSFKKMIVTRSAFVFKAYKSFILTEENISTLNKINALGAIVVFKLFNRGNVILQKIKFES